MPESTAPPTPNRYALALLGALQNRRGGRPERHVYAGTVPAEVVARRRAANKVARRSRRANRAHR